MSRLIQPLPSVELTNTAASFMPETVSLRDPDDSDTGKATGWLAHTIATASPLTPEVESWLQQCDPNALVTYEEEVYRDDDRYLITGTVPLLHFAAMLGDANMCRRLIACGADPLAVDEEFQKTALHWAAGTKKLETQIPLVEAGCRIDAPDKTGATPLLVALTYGNYANAAYLLEQGADANATARTGEAADHTAGAASIVSNLLASVWASTANRIRAMAMLVMLADHGCDLARMEHCHVAGRKGKAKDHVPIAYMAEESLYYLLLQIKDRHPEMAHRILVSALNRSDAEFSANFLASAPLLVPNLNPKEVRVLRHRTIVEIVQGKVPADTPIKPSGNTLLALMLQRDSVGNQFFVPEAVLNLLDRGAAPRLLDLVRFQHGTPELIERMVAVGADLNETDLHEVALDVFEDWHSLLYMAGLNANTHVTLEEKLNACRTLHRLGARLSDRDDTSQLPEAVANVLMELRLQSVAAPAVERRNGRARL